MSEMIRIQFQCTYDDYREANSSHAAAHRPGGKPARIWSGLAGWLVFVALSVALVYMVRATPQAATLSPAAQPTLPVTLPDGPALKLRFLYASGISLFLCGAWALIIGLTTVKRPHLAWRPPPRNQRWAAGIFTLLLVAAVIFWGAVPKAYPGPATDATAYEILLSVAPILLLVMIAVVFSATRGQRELKRRWEAQPFLQRPHTLEADDLGIMLEEPASMHRYQWAYFPGFRETTNTLLLYVSPYGFWIIPKRAFGTTEDLEAFKALLLTHVMEGTLLPSTTTGFPVKLLPPPGLPPPLPPTAHLASDVRNQPGA